MATVAALVLVALVMAAVESLGRPTLARRAAVDVDQTSVLVGGAAAAPAPTAPAASVAGAPPAPAQSPVVLPGPTPAPAAPVPAAVTATSGASALRAGTPAQHHGAGAVASSSADPHRLVEPAPHAPDPASLPPDSTPLAAAAGTEPDSMSPLSGLPAGWTSTVHRFDVGSMLRSYLLIRPRARSLTPLPVMVVLHGRNLTPAAIEQITRMPAITGPAIQVYPAGYGRSWDAGGCCGVAHSAHVDDVAFLTATVRQVLASQHDAAADRVYVVGYSNGGRMAYRLACAAPGMWAGIAAVEAVPVDSCPSTHAVPVIVVASSHDPLLSLYDTQPRKVMQGYVEPSVQATVEGWRALDGCSSAASVTVAGAATIDAWHRCNGSGRVAYALYRGGGHAWPAGSGGSAPTPSAGQLVWSWLIHATPVTAAAT